MRLIGLNDRAYFIGHFLCDYLFYVAPTFLIIVMCLIADYRLFSDYSIVKSLSMLSFGFVIIPVNYLLSFLF